MRRLFPFCYTMADETSKPEDTNVQTELDENETAKDLRKSRKITRNAYTQDERY